MKRNALSIPTAADIAVIFSTELLDPRFDDADAELLDISRHWHQRDNDTREAA